MPFSPAASTSQLARFARTASAPEAGTALTRAATSSGRLFAPRSSTESTTTPTGTPQRARPSATRSAAATCVPATTTAASQPGDGGSHAASASTRTVAVAWRGMNASFTASTTSLAALVSTTTRTLSGVDLSFSLFWPARRMSAMSPSETLLFLGITSPRGRRFRTRRYAAFGLWCHTDCTIPTAAICTDIEDEP